MAEEDDLYYLQPGFDLSSLTVPKLRNLLVEHNVTYPSSAKKSQLVGMIEAEILPKTKKLLRQRDRVRRTSKGITDMSSQETIEDDDGDADRELMPPPPAPKTPRSRKSKSTLSDAAATPSTSRRSKTPTAQKSSSKPRASDTETDGERMPQSARKSRKSLPESVERAVRVQEPARMKREDGSSPFSAENPFQSGSSPPSESRRVSSTSRNRKSQGRQSTSRRRETTSPPIKREDDGPSRSTYQFPVSSLSDEIPATEEFTPDATRELREANGQLVSKRSQALVRKKKKPASKAAKSVPGVVLTVVLGALATWYRQEKVSVGYCGVGQPSWSLASNPNIPNWVHENLQPACEPCPPHAICYQNMEVKCEDDFIVQHHPLNLNGFVPIPPTCEPDSEKERRIKAVADRAVEELRERRAAYECGDELSTEEAEVNTIVKAAETKLEIAEESLKAEISKSRRRGMSSDEFEDLWNGALGDIVGRDEVEVIRDGSGRRFLSSSSVAKLPLTCALRRWTLRTLAAYRITIALLILATGGVAYGRHRILSYQEATAQIPSLVAKTLDRLVTQAALKEDERVSEGFIAAGQLRDDVLRNVFSVSERERVWQNVRKIVEGNSNVRAATREGGKTGEWSRVWEWIGPVDLAPGLEGRKSGLLRSDAEGKITREREDVEVRKWDEGRPIY